MEVIIVFGLCSPVSTDDIRIGASEMGIGQRG